MTPTLDMRQLVVAFNCALPALALAVVGLAHPAQLSIANADRWYGVHVVLLVLFPVLAIPLVWLVRTEPVQLRAAVATLAFLYAVFYGAQDAIAGIGLGSVMRQTSDPEKITALQPTATLLFDESNANARVGLWCFLAASVLVSLAIVRRRRAAALPGAVLLCAAAISFLDSHVYWPRGVMTMLVIAAGAAALAAVSPTGTVAGPAARGAKAARPAGRSRTRPTRPVTASR